MLSDQRSALVLLSGGLDSAACVLFLRENDYAVHGLYVDYGQPARKAEKIAATKIAVELGIGLSTIEVTHDRPISEGELVGRNATLVLTALTFYVPPPNAIVLGIHKGTPYYDCSASFASALDKLVGELSSGVTRLITPFVNGAKGDIVHFLRARKFPLSLAHSCESADEPCGCCQSCRDREAISC